MKTFAQHLIFFAVIGFAFAGFYVISKYEKQWNGQNEVAEAQAHTTYITSTTSGDSESAPHALPLASQITNTPTTIIDTPIISPTTTKTTPTPKPSTPKYTTDPKAYTFPSSVGVPLTQKVTGPAPSGTAASVPVLLYHGEGNLEGSTPVEAFVNQMQTLKKAGWNTITLSQFYDYMKNGKPVPDKSFLLTFDDGRKDSYYPVDPVLKQLDYTAVMFVITGFSMPDTGNPSQFYLSKEELTQMAKSGRWELESHGKEDHRQYVIATSTPDGMVATTTGHFLSNRFLIPNTTQLESDNEYRQRITADLTLSKMTLEQDFGKPVIAFAYPFNDFGQDTVNYPDAKKALADIVPSIYTFAFYQTWLGEGEMFNSPDPDTYMIRRIEPNPNWNGTQLLNLLENSRVRTLPYQQGNSFGPEWTSSWGIMQSGQILVLSATPNTTGASAVLKGSSNWKDYSLTTYVDWNAGSEASLITRRRDATHYLTCDFSNGTAFIEEHINGKQKILARAAYTQPQTTENIPLNMTVDGKYISCSINGQSVVNGRTENSTLLSGGVGLQIWNPTTGTAEMHVRTVVVEEK